MATLSLVTKYDAMSAIRTFLLAVLPAGVEVVAGLDNRVPEPTSQNFAILTPISSLRLETNSTDFVDVFFEASAAGTALTVSTVHYGTISVGQRLYGEDVPANTFVTAIGATPGQYVISPAMTLASRPMASGYRVDNVPVQNTFQCDIHGPDSFNNTQIVSAMYRSDWAVDKFQESSSVIAPLFCSDPRQMAFRNGEQQIEQRWSIDLTVQCNNRVVVPQDYFDNAEVSGIVDVDVFYPA